ncbi:hypothetical protein [Microcoleus sp. herbarium13]
MTYSKRAIALFFGRGKERAIALFDLFQKGDRTLNRASQLLKL